MALAASNLFLWIHIAMSTDATELGNVREDTELHVSHVTVSTVKCHRNESDGVTPKMA